MGFRPPSAGSSQTVTPGSGGKSWRVLDQTASNFPMSEFDDNGKLWITADSGDSAQNINLVNRTTAKTASGGTAWWRPQIGFWVKRPGDAQPLLRWQAPALDVTSGVAGSDADPRSDMVLAYRKDLVNNNNSADVIYIVDEPAGRIGVHTNVPRAVWHVGIRGTSPRDAGLIVDNFTGTDQWLVSYDENGSRGGGVFKPTGQFARLRLGGASTPQYEADISGVLSSDFIRLASTTTAWQNSTAPRMYSTSNPGAGAYPFNNSGHFVIQPRAELGTFGGDIVCSVGLTPAPFLIVQGPSSGGPNVLIGGAVAGDVGGGVGVIGLANATTFPSANPNKAVLLQQSGMLNHLNINGERTGLGQVGPSAQPGLRVGLARGFDTTMYRVAAAVFGIGTVAMTAPTMTGAGLMLANVTTAPSTNPTGGGVIYCEAGALKYRGTAGTVTTLGAA